MQPHFVHVLHGKNSHTGLIYFFQFCGTDFELGYLGYRVQCVVGQAVGRGLGEVERREERPWPHTVGDFRSQFYAASPGRHSHKLPLRYAQGLGVARVYLHRRSRH